MATFTTSAAILTSWTNGPVAKILDQAVTLTMSADAPTYIDALGVTQVLRGLRQWGFSTEGMVSSPLVCTVPSITFANGYTTNIVGFDLTYSVPAVDATSAGTDATAYWRTFLQGVPSWSGNMFFHADDTEAGVAIATQAPTSCTMLFDGTNGFEGDIVTNSLSEQVRIGGVPAIQKGFQGGGALDVQGSNNILADGDAAKMTTGTAVLTYGTGVTRTGDAFFTSLAISARVGEPVTYSINAQGTGDLAFSDPGP